MLSLLTKKEKMKKKLKESTEDYQQRRKIDDIKEDLNKSNDYIEMVKKRVMLE